MKRKPEENPTDSDIYTLLEPSVALWFRTAFKGFTESQRKAIPAIMKNKNTLIFSQTGTGKTLAAFTAAINMLFSLAKQGKLEDRVYVVYVSPLRALANDIRKNLLTPLEGIKELEGDVDIRVLVRSGDTPSHKRTLMLKSPPHILITTPETLAIILNAPKFSSFLHDVSYVIVDEIHALCDSKRGAHLSLSLERLARISPGMVRIGLSATQAPLDLIARFLAGKGRDVNIVSVPPAKDFDAEIILPSKDLSESYEVLREKMIDTLSSLIAQHRTTIVFTNTRSGTESVVHALKKRGILAAEPHHGSMSKEERVAVEDRLKRGELSCVVTSTSLELGIDVGSVDLVVQIGSPKSVSKALQRIGRAGHSLSGRSKARFVVFDKDDLVETSVLLEEARHGNIDRVDIPQNCLDVLAQHIVGMSLEKEWHVEEAYDTVKKSYTYSGLKRLDFDDVLRFLSAESEDIYPRITLRGKTFSSRKGSRMLYLTNIGTIPESTTFRVIHENGFLLGTLSESFVSRLSGGDIFVLGGKSLELVDTDKEKIFVRNAMGKAPTIPSWSGEAMPRSYDLSCAVGRARRRLFEELEKRDPQNVLEEYLYQQSFFGKPSDRTMLVEQYVDRKKQLHLIVHSIFGRRVNEALCFMISSSLRKEGLQFKTSIGDDGFLFVFPRIIEVNPDSLFSIPDERPQIRTTELFRTHFRHVAQRSLAVVRTWKGKRLPLKAQKARASFLLRSCNEDHVLLRETEREILFSYMDYARASQILSDIKENRIDIKITPPSDVPSPFSLNILLSSKSDLMILEERGSLLAELQEKVYGSVFEKSNPLFSSQEIASHFAGGEVQGETLEGKIHDLLSEHGPLAMAQIEEKLSCGRQEAETILLGSKDVVSGYFVRGDVPQYMLSSDREALLKKHYCDEANLFRLLAKKHFRGFADADDVFRRYGIVGSMEAVYARVGFPLCKTVSAKIFGKRYYVKSEDLPLYVSAYRTEELSPKEHRALEEIGDGISIEEFLRGEDRREILYTLEENLWVVRREGRLERCLIKPSPRKQARIEVVKKYLSSCGPATMEEIREFCGFPYGEIKEALDEIKATQEKIFGTFTYDVFCFAEDVAALKTISSFHDRLRILDMRDPYVQKIRYELAQKYPDGQSPIIREGKLVGAMASEISDYTLFVNDVWGPADCVGEIMSEIYNHFRFLRRKGVRRVKIKRLFGVESHTFSSEIESAGFVLEKGRLMRGTRKKIEAQDWGFMLLQKGFFGRSSGKDTLYEMISSHLFMTEIGCASRLLNFDPSNLEELISVRKVCTMSFSGRKVLVADRNIPLINFLTRKEGLSEEEKFFLDTFPDSALSRGYGKIFERLKRNNYLICFSDYERNTFEVDESPDVILSLLLSTNPPLTTEEIRSFTGLPYHTIAECLEKYSSYFSGRQVYTDRLLAGRREGILLLDGDDPLSILFGHDWDKTLKLPKGEKKYILAGGMMAGGMVVEVKEGKTTISDLVFLEEFAHLWLALLEQIQAMGEVTIRRVNGKEVKSASGWF